MKNLDCVCFGSIVLDYRRRLTRDQNISSSLQLTNEPINLRIGGISILAIALKRMGFNTAVVGQVGKDIIGYGIKTYLREKYEINTEEIRLTAYSTSHSIINLTDEERYIEHNIGASAFLEADERIMLFINKTKPTLVTIGYSGLLPKMDCNNGAKMAKFIDVLKSKGIKTALDTHTMDKDYSMLKEPLRNIDIFFCNTEEAKNISKEETPENMLTHIVSSYLKDNAAKYRVLGITLPNGVYIAYGKNGVWDKGFIESPWYTDRPQDLTGAGDAFRAGFYAYLIRNIQSFDEGTFEWQRAGMLGNFTAAIMVTEGFSGIKNYAEMLERSGLS